MTSSLGHILPSLANFLRYFSVVDGTPSLDLTRLSPRDLADLNLPSDLKGRLLARHDADKIRRSL